MGSRIFTLGAAMALSGTVSLASAQTAPPPVSMTPLQTAVACAPPPFTSTERADAPRIVGSQDTVDRALFGQPEVLVIDAGSTRDVQVNRMYFVRRVYRGAETQHDTLPHSVQTTGWVRVVAVNANTALVSPEHVCSAIEAGDYLEQFRVPDVPPDDAAIAPLVQTDLDFNAYTRVLYGDYERRSSGTGDFVVIDHGADRNIRVGARFGIYRDLELDRNPLKPIGEAIAVSVGPSLALVRITHARDAIFTDDVLVPRTSDRVTPVPSAPPESPRRSAPSRTPPQMPRGR